MKTRASDVLASKEFDGMRLGVDRGERLTPQLKEGCNFRAKVGVTYHRIAVVLDGVALSGLYIPSTFESLWIVENDTDRLAEQAIQEWLKPDARMRLFCDHLAALVATRESVSRPRGFGKQR